MSWLTTLQDESPSHPSPSIYNPPIYKEYYIPWSCYPNSWRFRHIVGAHQVLPEWTVNGRCILIFWLKSQVSLCSQTFSFPGFHWTWKLTLSSNALLSLIFPYHFPNNKTLGVGYRMEASPAMGRIQFLAVWFFFCIQKMLQLRQSLLS
jgi:hypothetical protein